MDKEYFVSINEVAKRLSVPAHTLRYWEKQFPTAIRPTTGAGGRRYYRPEVVVSSDSNIHVNNIDTKSINIVISYLEQARAILE